MKTILIAGGAGFIGTNLTKFILQHTNDRVICLDNLYTGSLDNVKQFEDDYPDRFMFLMHDIVQDIIISEDIDQVYNLACPASPKAYQRDELYTLDVSIKGTRNLLQLAQRHNALFLQASTSEVYGDPDISPQSETYNGNVNMHGIRACYDEGKRVSETLCSIYRRHHSVDTKIVRIFNTFGPYMQPDDGRFISNFINQILDDEPITVYGNGDQTRSILYVDDLVRGLYMMMNSAECGPINIGSSFEKTVLEFANIIAELMGVEPNIVHEALPQHDPMQRRANNSLAMHALNWKPEVPVVTGLLKTIEYFKSLKH